MKNLKRSIFILLLIASMFILTACNSEKTVENKKYNLKLSEELTITGTYTGVMFDKHPNGQGTFVAETEKGTLTYEGIWTDGVCEEKGKIKDMPYSIEYEGETIEGVYNGEVSEFKPSGEGSFNYEKEDKYFNYDGVWKKGKPSGKGYLESNFYVVHFAEVDRTGEYKGQVSDLLAKGNGIFNAATSEGVSYTYEGEWSKGLYNGLGKTDYHNEDYVDYYGNFKDGEFYPTPYQFFKTMETAKDCEYTITQNAEKVLEEYPQMFLSNSTEDCNIGYEENFSYKAFAKNQEEYGDKLIKVSLRVVHINEYDSYGNNKMTFFIGEDSGHNVYYVIKYGYTKDVYEGNRIVLTALPLDYFTYPNISGTSIWAIMCAGVKVD